MRIARALVSALLLVGCGGAKTTQLEGPPPPTGEAVPLPPAAGTDSNVGAGFKIGPAGFPVPDDADGGQAVGSDNTGYKIPRPKDAVYAQLKPKLEEQGFRLEQYIPQASSHRMILLKDNYKIIASVTETDAKSCTLFITVKPAGSE